MWLKRHLLGETPENCGPLVALHEKSRTLVWLLRY